MTILSCKELSKENEKSLELNAIPALRLTGKYTVLILLYYHPLLEFLIVSRIETEGKGRCLQEFKEADQTCIPLFRKIGCSIQKH